ncbi:MAG: DNA gyrase subunit A [Firmicutes bacterium]|nr:DNA gyrase subunit A [Bacillota bacterium]
MDENKNYDQIIDADLSGKMKSFYIDYAMSVIVSRAIPDVRDGLKPVHRRIMYDMHELKLLPGGGYKKSARIVGDTMGKYHPHGDASIYDALVRLAQDFSLRYPLVDGHGNFGSIDGYQAAASRYTEAKMAKISLPLLADIEKDTVDYIDNYDGEYKEPTVLPCRFPNLLVNGSTGIAVGMATNIPPHNLKEVINALIKMIDNRIEENRDTEIDEILQIIKGPDFPTGASIIGRSGMEAAYRTGRGKLRVRSACEVRTAPSGKESIVVTEIPFNVNKSRMISGIAELVKEKKIEGVSDIHDHSDRNGINIIIDCKKEASAEVVMNKLFKYSQLEESYSVNFLAIVNGVPKTLNIKEMLSCYMDHQENVVTRRTQFDKKKAEARMHIVEGLLIALDNIDEVITIVRSSKTTAEARERLQERFSLTEIQANSIIEMRIRALVGLEREKLEDERAELEANIKEWSEILADKNKLISVIKTELIEIRDKYGDERRTKILPNMGEIDMEDLIDDYLSAVTITNLNYVKRISLDTYKSQNRGGKGIKGLQTREEDFARNLLISSNHSYILFFTTKGKVYRMKTWEIPEAGRNAKGTPIVNLLPLEPEEKISACVPVKHFGEGQYLTMVTEQGIIKRSSLRFFENIRKTGIKAINLMNDDSLVTVIKTTGDDQLFIATRNGMAIRFKEEEVRGMSRTSYGVKAIALKEGDYIIGAALADPEYKVLTVTENGYGKCTGIDNFKLQHRGGIGLRSYAITEKTGKIVSISMVKDGEELIMITDEGIVIRIKVRDIRTTSGRVASGVKLVNMDEGVKLVSVDKIREEAIASEDSEDIDQDENYDIGNE